MVLNDHSSLSIQMSQIEFVFKFQRLVFWRQFNSEELSYEFVMFLYLYLFNLTRNERNEMKAVLELDSCAPRVTQY